ncbi:Hsp20/alpha crystallin family protein [bacterium]|nr:Hsp20/alpha crystallin family protein [bacterium]
MALVRWKPFRPLSEMMEWPKDIEKMFEDYFESKGAEKLWAPEVDIYEDENSIFVEAEIPGMDKDNINITVNQNSLTLSGKKEMKDEVKGKDYHRIERTYGEFKRSFSLPTTTDLEKIDATYEQGVLKITVPKLEKAKPKEIPVKVK